MYLVLRKEEKLDLTVEYTPEEILLQKEYSIRWVASWEGKIHVETEFEEVIPGGLRIKYEGYITPKPEYRDRVPERALEEFDALIQKLYTEPGAREGAPE